MRKEEPSIGAATCVGIPILIVQLSSAMGAYNIQSAIKQEALYQGIS
jgi:hypothetical protein